MLVVIIVSLVRAILSRVMTINLYASFGGRIPIEKGTAFFFYKAHSDTSRLLYQLKYGSHPEIGEHLGRIVAAEFVQDGFFDGITAVVPVPLARQRERERGYNQSMEIVRGISAETGLPILDKVLERISFMAVRRRKDVGNEMKT